MTWLSKWFLSTTILFLGFLILSLGFDGLLEFTLEKVLPPLEIFFGLVLSDVWFNLGNIPFGLAIMFFGFLICSVIIGGIFTFVDQFRKKE